MAVWAVLLPLLLGCLQFQARLVLELAASYMIVATLNWMLMACRALCAWQGSIRQGDGGIISPVKLDQIGLMKVHSVAMPPCTFAAALCRLMPGPHQRLAAGLCMLCAIASDELGLLCLQRVLQPASCCREH